MNRLGWLFVAALICLSFCISSSFAQTIAPKTILNQPATSAPPPSALGADILNASRSLQMLLAQCQGNNLSQWFPTHWNDQLAECFWEQKGFAVLQNAKIVGDMDQGSAAVEIASGFLKGLRLAYTQAVTASTSDNTSTTPQQNAAEHSYKELLTNGGNVAFTFSYPIFGVSSDNGGYFLINSYAQSAGSIKALGESEQFGASTALSDMNAHLEVAAETNGLYPLTGPDKMDLVVYSRIAAVDGTSRFNTFLNRSKSSPFAYGQIGAGVRLGGLLTFVVSVTKPTDKSLPGAKPTLTVSLSRQAKQP